MNSLRLVKRNISSPVFISNRIFNYNLFRKQTDDLLPEKFIIRNLKYKNDLNEIQNYQKTIASRDWKLVENKENNVSSLNREFNFDSVTESLAFMNIIKAKCEEIDHHPEWSLQDNKLVVNLTSHSQKNNVSTKDYELAAFMTQQFEDKDLIRFLYNRCNQCWISGAFAVLLSVLSVTFLWKLYNVERNYRITSRDFLFAKINFDTNDYNNERKLSKL